MQSPASDLGVRYILYGGSFNPPQWGHLRVIKQLLKQFPKAIIYIVPNYVSPFKISLQKKHNAWASASERFNMLELLLEELEDSTHQRLKLVDWEIKKRGPSYTIETLDFFQRGTGADAKKIALAIGWDSFESLPSWERGAELMEKYSLIVFHRRGQEKKGTEWMAQFPKLNYCALPDVSEASSSQVRELLQRLESCQDDTEQLEIWDELEGLIPMGLLSYILQKGLYGANCVS